MIFPSSVRRQSDCLVADFLPAGSTAAMELALAVRGRWKYVYTYGHRRLNGAPPDSHSYQSQVLLLIKCCVVARALASFCHPCTLFRVPMYVQSTDGQGVRDATSALVVRTCTVLYGVTLVCTV